MGNEWSQATLNEKIAVKSFDQLKNEAEDIER